MSDIASYCGSTAELVSKLTLSDEVLTLIEQHTRGQSSNSHWHRLRKGRITASNFYRVHTKVQSLRKNPNTECDKLVKNLIEPTSISHLPQIQRGSMLESEAINALIAQLTNEGHVNVKVQECGLYLYKPLQYIGASPDGILTCDCCEGQCLVEIKCPSSPVSELSYLLPVRPLSKSIKLKKSHSYFGQVQGQMLVTGLKKTYFFVYTTDGGTHCELINMKENFCKQLVSDLEVFFTQCMAPQLLSQPRAKKSRLL